MGLLYPALKPLFFWQPPHTIGLVRGSEPGNAPWSLPGMLPIRPISPPGLWAANEGSSSPLTAESLHLSWFNAILLDLILESSPVRPSRTQVLSSGI